MDRRNALRALGAVPLMGIGAACARLRKERMEPTSKAEAPLRARARMPVIFAAHGAPMVLEDAVWMGELAAWALAMPKPASILMVSAHWDERPLTLGATSPLPLIYDFYGFPERFYKSTYPSPGAPLLAGRVRDLLRQRQVAFADDPARGLDHGAYVPLLAMVPNADVPVLQVSLPGLDPKKLFELGEALAPLRDEGVLIVGSGFLTHNMQFAFKKGTPDWAREFDQWSAAALSHFDVDGLMDFRRRAPAAALALPTWEHYAPLLVSAGAASTHHTPITFPITGFWMDGAFTRRSVQLG